jgi:enoyl-CoA hydratase/carnithine racemase
VKLVVLKSSVPGLFSAGGNLKYFYTASYATFKNNDIFKELYAALNGIRKPIVTAIHGIAMGGGF